MSKLFVPSSEKLLAMIAQAEVKCNADRLHMTVRREAELDERAVRQQVAAVKSRYYFRVQHGWHR